MKEIMISGLIDESDVVYFYKAKNKDGITYHYLGTPVDKNKKTGTLKDFVDHFNYQDKNVIEFLEKSLS
ncbi:MULTISPECIES: hypothetical protein [unclassified Enterococcus]|uniref:hypothetical protein n=1 Tax=unclassified Enterococcus TaxID=2608891 RepID=UPI0019074ECA|nr:MULTISPECIES: hypothetical protein [unclassified Enterococcus]MBK0037998.1 hypothetical protein [Enterococcus sp. S52]MBK0070673.1 hypothetical protein [Enterococcus sp. S53]MBK0141324.1 hypothetical protein [Enterococcus sp. S76]MBK0144712.1 hypothetical protein [Enterococcus sp. S77]